MSREEVLTAIRRALQGRDPTPLPEVKTGKGEPELGWDEFETALTEAQGTIIHPIGLDGLAERIATITGGDHHCSGAAAELLDQPALSLPPAEVDGLSWVVASGFLAVATTGSVAVRAAEVPQRLHLVLAKNLILLVPADALVNDLWDLYGRIAPESLAGGYMTLISGPSKTADIELELVTGAHGPFSLTVIAYT